MQWNARMIRLGKKKNEKKEAKEREKRKRGGKEKRGKKANWNVLLHQ
mgnify:CR=1 FL=1